eukprot:766133-Hanusia_phi.AAC.3
MFTTCLLSYRVTDRNLDRLLAGQPGYALGNKPTSTPTSQLPLILCVDYPTTVLHKDRQCAHGSKFGKLRVGRHQEPKPVAKKKTGREMWEESQKLEAQAAPVLSMGTKPMCSVGGCGYFSDDDK